jgi:tetratricopeptide (TPR) repeat protein
LVDRKNEATSRRAKIEAQLIDSPDDSFLNYAWALQVASEGEIPLAIERLQSLLELYQNYVPAWFQLAQLFAKSDATSMARETLVRGIEVARRAGDSHAEGEMRTFLEGLAAN